ncbi:hypothetical protein AC579_3746, partial [Pseudocercospora musae]
QFCPPLPSFESPGSLHTSTATNKSISSMSVAHVSGMRVNGKQWHQPRNAFRPAAGQTSYAKRVARESKAAEIKKVENEMKTAKEEERQRHVQAIKDRRAAKEEKERYQKMAEKMHKKRVERLKRREKRNKLLKS